jgi:hypothetical protein
MFLRLLQLLSIGTTAKLRTEAKTSESKDAGGEALPSTASGAKVDQKSTPSTFHFSHEGHQPSVTILVQTSANCPPPIWPGASKETKDDPKERKETKEDNI